MSRKITVTEALVNIKVLTARIDKVVRKVPTLRTICKGDVSLIDNLSKEEVKTRIQSYLDSTKDLLVELRTIKGAINFSNATNKVEVAGNVYTIAEAIDRKHTLKYESATILELTRKLERNNSSIESVLKDNRDKLAIAIAEVASANGNVEEVTQKFKLEIYDPFDIFEKVKDLDEASTKFMEEVNIKLNLHNATTFIEI